MGPHPFCNKIPLRTGIKTLAVLNFAGFFLFMMSGAIKLSVEKEPIPLDKNSFGLGQTKLNPTWICIANIAAGAFGMIVSLFLLQGARTNSVWKLRVFVSVELLSATVCIIEILKNPSSNAFSMMVGIVVQIYFAWVVESFIREVKSEQKPVSEFTCAK